MQEIFVFGSNLAGRHGAGAALHAKEHCGAIYGRGEGLQGNSYAIPIKDGRNRADLKDPRQTLALSAIGPAVDRFLTFARAHSELQFQITAIGCGLAGYKPDQIAPFFQDHPANCILPSEFTIVLKTSMLRQHINRKTESKI